MCIFVHLTISKTGFDEAQDKAKRIREQAEADALIAVDALKASHPALAAAAKKEQEGL